MSHGRRQWDSSTKLNHPVEVPVLEGNRPLLQPIYHSVKFAPSENFPYWDQFIYGRISNPTTRQLELTLAELQKREDCIVLGSGIAAVTGTILGLVKAGEHVISFREVYKPARTFIRDFLKRFNIESSVLSLSKLDEIEQVIKSKKTKLIHFESPSNPNLDIADIHRILQIAKKHDVLVSMDGTFAGLHQHTEFNVDVMVHSLTKYGNGHGDVIAGSIAGRKETIKAIRESTMYFGAALDPQAAYLIERGLKTYMLRYKRQTETAHIVATFLASRPEIKIVRYPGLASHEGRDLAQLQMQDMGGIIAFEIEPNVASSADQFCHRLKLIQLAASLGSTESVICPTEIFFGLDLDADEKLAMGINPYSLRLSIGLEDAQDLIADLKEALG